MINLRKVKILPKIMLSSILCIQVLGILFLNLKFSRDNIDFDSAKLFVHAIEMWENGTVLIPGWSYITTLELDCSLFLAVPLYGLINDIYISFSIANIIFLLILIWTIFRLFKNNGGFYPAVWSLILICIPYRIGHLDYMNMLFFNGSQYIIKVTIPLMLLSLLLTSDEIKSKNIVCKVKYILFLLVYLALVFVTSFSSGVYVAFCGLFPVVVGYFVWRIYNKKKIVKDFYIYSCMSILFSVAGILFNYSLKINAKGNSMTLCSIYDLQDNIEACFWGLFEVFGGVVYSSTEILSYTGINTLLRMLFVILLLVCGLCVLKKTLNRTSRELDSILLAVFIWNFFVLCICNTRYGSLTSEYRYHLIGVIPLICAAVSTFFSWYSDWDKEIKMGGLICASLAVLVLSVTSYRTVINMKADNSTLQQVCDYANELDVEFVYFLNDSQSPEICRLLDYEKAIYLQVMDNGYTLAFDYYGKYVGAAMDFENSVLVVDNTINDFGESLEMVGRKFERCKIFADKSIYYSTGLAEGK